MSTRTADGPTLLPEAETLADGANFAAVSGGPARAQIDELARKYTGDAYPPEKIKSERVILRITPERQTYIDQKRGIAD